jgi:hypothetical protein
VASWPKVFGLMPTTPSRADFVTRATQFWATQDYAGEMQLVIEASSKTLPVKLDTMITERADVEGAIFFRWDDDDYHGPSRVRRQVEALLADPLAEVCGLCPTLYYHRAYRQVLSFITSPLDATIAFRRAYWDRGSQDVEPWRKLARQPKETIVTIAGALDYVWIRHGMNHSPDPETNDSRWRPASITANEIERLLAS